MSVCWPPRVDVRMAALAGGRPDIFAGDRIGYGRRWRLATADETDEGGRGEPGGTAREAGPDDRVVYGMSQPT